MSLSMSSLEPRTSSPLNNVVSIITGALRQRVAVVVGMTSPVGGLVCLKLLQEGVRLLLVEDETDLHQLPLDVNLLWAGLDTNYADRQYRDPWGARPIAAYVSREEGNVSNIWTERSLSMFGRRPDFVIDIDRGLKDRQLKDIIDSKAPLRPMCIRPFEDKTLWSQGWLGTHGVNSHPIHPEMSPSVMVYGFSSQETVDRLLSRMETDTDRLSMPSGHLLTCWTDDLMSTLTCITSNGHYIKPTYFDVFPHLTDVSPSGRCRLVFSNENLLPEKELRNAKDDQMKCPSTEPVVDVMEWDGYISSDSDVVNNGTFDAVLQKSKDYPIDWWQGGSECMLAVDDINCKAMTRAAVHCTVRWLLFGYFVIAFAVPKALGWEGP